jgi:CRISPR-associated protein Cmr1
MARMTLTLKLVTPLIMAGAYNGAYRDPHPARPEIRAASIRGVLRYWLRAVYGAAYGKNIDALREAETRIFGSTERGSGIMVRVEHQLTPDTGKTHFVLPEQVDSRNGKIDYKFPGFKQSGTIDLHLIAHPLRRDVFSPALISALLLAFTIGGFGKRARRGGGAMQVIGVEAPDMPSGILDMLRALEITDGKAPATVLQDKIFPYITQAIADLPQPRPYDARAVPAYPVFAEDHCRVFIGTTGNNGYRDALKQIWNLTTAYHRVSGKWAWGYAIQKSRRASALHMRVYQCADKRYYPVATFFRGGSQDEKWDRVQEVIGLFEKEGSSFIRVFGNQKQWT